MTPVHYLSEPVKHVGDVLSVSAVVAIFLHWLPNLTAILAFVWLVMRIVESRQAIRLNNLKLLTLRQVYDAALKEPVPEPLTKLVQQLEDK